MTTKKAIFLGNSIFFEDKIGIVVGRVLKEGLERKGFEVEILEKAWIQLLDVVSGVKELVIVDSIVVEREEDVGKVFIVDINSFRGSHVKAPHTLSLADVLSILRMYNLEVPEKILVIGIGIQDTLTLSEDLSDRLKDKIEEICSEIVGIVDSNLDRNFLSF